MKWKKIKHFLFDGFLFLVLYEMLEEALEELIALFFVSALANSLSLILCVSLTQGTKIIIKKTIKILTYKKGDDKMNFLKKTAYIIWNNIFVIMLCFICAIGGHGLYGLLVMAQWGKITLSALFSVIGILMAFGVGFRGYNEIKIMKEESLKNRKFKKENKLISSENKKEKKDIYKLNKKILKDKKSSFKNEFKNLKKNAYAEAEKIYKDEKIKKEQESIQENIQEQKQDVSNTDAPTLNSPETNA